MELGGIIGLSVVSMALLISNLRCRRRAKDAMATAKEAVDAVEPLQSMLAAVEAERDEERRQRKWLEERIAGIVREKNDWAQRCHQVHAGASAAQEWLLRDLRRVAEVANGFAKRLGKKPVQIDPRLAEFIDELRQAPPAISPPGGQTPSA